MSKPQDPKIEEVMESLKKNATGYEVTETVIEKGPVGAPKAKQRKKHVRGDPKAAKAFLELQAKFDKSDDEAPQANWMEITPDERLLLKSSKVCEIMQISDKTLSAWEKKGAPKEKRGWWDIAALVNWRGRAVGIQGGPGAEADKLAADTRLKQARAAIAEQELRIKSGKLISVVLVEERLTEAFGSIRTSMMAIADHVMTEIYSQYPELAPQVRGLIDTYVREGLKEVADSGRFCAPASRRPAKKTGGRPRRGS